MSWLNSYNIWPLISAIFLLCLGIVVVKKNKKSLINFLFFLICIATFFWQFGFFISFALHSEKIAVIVAKFIYAGIIMIPVLFYHFLNSFTQLEPPIGFESRNKKSPYYKYFLLIAYGVSFIYEGLLIFTNYIVNGVYHYTWGFYPKAGLLHPIFVIVVLSLWSFKMIMFLVSAIKRKDISQFKKQQYKYFLIAFIFYLLSAGDFLGNYGLQVYTCGFLFIFIFVVIIAYTIVAFRLMDIKFVLRKSIVYLFSLGSTATFVFLIKFNVNNFIYDTGYWFDALLIVIALAIYRPIQDYFFRLANKYFFTSLYDAKKIIADLGDELSTTLDANVICKTVEKHLTQSLHPKAIALFDYNETTKLFDIRFNYGFQFKANGVKIAKYVQEKHFFKSNVIVLEDIKSNPNSRLDNFAKDFRANLGIEVVVPMIIKDKVVGFIALGAKESSDIYNSEDVQFLSVIGNQVAMSLENSWLYEEAKNFNIKLTKEVDRATKELREANGELKKLDEAKSEFISIASHQLRTPLTVIKGYTSMMLEGDMGALPEGPIKDSMTKVYESNERLIALVEDLLNISRIESGRMKYDFVEDTLESVVDSVTEELTMNANKKDLYLKYQKPSTPTGKIKLDKMKLRQVIMNMIDNSLKYTPKGGVTVKIYEQDGHVRMAVSDTGMGIHPDDLPHLFKKFSRGENSATIHTEGTGLGLYVGKMIIEEHGGRIWAESEGENKGATFTIELPILNGPLNIETKDHPVTAVAVPPLLVKEGKTLVVK